MIFSNVSSSKSVMGCNKILYILLHVSSQLPKTYDFSLILWHMLLDHNLDLFKITSNTFNKQHIGEGIQCGYIKAVVSLYIQFMSSQNFKHLFKMFFMFMHVFGKHQYAIYKNKDEDF